MRFCPRTVRMNRKRCPPEKHVSDVYLVVISFLALPIP
jgi:hypothetical protein